MAKAKFEIIDETDDYVAVNKSAGLLTIPDREQSEKSLKEFLNERCGQIFTVHRLDKDTSGLLIFAKTEEAHKFYSQLFEQRSVEKFYLGIVIGAPFDDKGLIDAAIAESTTRKGFMIVHRRGKPSQTAFEVQERNKFYSLLSFRLLTGRTHQIRVHCKEIGHPLACDPLYGDGKPVFLSSIKRKFKISQHDDGERPMLDRLALHSFRLNFTDRNGVRKELIAEAPKEFKALMKQVGKLNS